jgi:hypothetical protein
MPDSPKKTQNSKQIPPNFRPLEGSERRPPPKAEFLGPADPKETLSVTIVLRRRPDGPPVPDPSFFAATPPSQRRRMSTDEFAAKYGAAPADIDRVTEFAKAHGLTVVETHPARRTVVASGTVAEMNEAFAVSLGRYRVEHPPGRRERQPRTETYRGRDGFIHVPNALAEIIVGVFGLDNRRVIKRNSPDPPNTVPLPVSTLRTLYNFPTNSAVGQTIAILSEAGYQPADISSTFGGSPPSVTDVTVDASNNGTADPETTQDICIAALAAPGAAIAVYFTMFTQQGWVDLVQRVVHPNPGDPVCSVLSSSFYVSDGDDSSTLANEGISTSWLDAATAAFLDAAIQGVTVCCACGDTGSASLGTQILGDGKAHVQYPASDPWVLSVGGTTVGNVIGTGFDEYVWNDSGGATGGGVSDFFGPPSYQSGAAVPPSINDSHAGRGVPDVAANASPNAGYSGLFLNGSPTTGTGTSASTPLWAGLIAVINVALGENVGFLNPTLYAIGSSGFRDIVGAPGPADNGFSGVTGYPAGPGWDACTGWGSINGAALLAELQQFFAKACMFAIDRDHYGQDEVDALRTQPGGAVVKGAFFVIVDGFTPKDLGIVDFGSLAAAPVVTFTPSTGVTNRCSSLASDDPSFGPEVQRFRFGYDVDFGTSDKAFTSFAGGSETVKLSTTYQGLTAKAQVKFIKQPDPYILQGPETWWLSNDIRLIQVAHGGSQFGVTMGNDPFAFLSAVTSALEAGQGTAGGQSFDTNTQEDNEVITVAPQNGAGKNVYNFAIARVHYRGSTSKAKSVRVFFRLFAANSTATDFQPGSTYARFPAVYPVPTAKFFQHVLPTSGVSAGEYVSVPCFGEARKDAAQAGAANSLPSKQTPDGFNVRDLQATHGPLHDTFYGCWLDINQMTPVLPAMPPPGNPDGPWPPSTGISLEPLRQAFIVNDHQCLVAEIAFDPVAIDTGTQPFNSDKLAQRNISWSYVANPGDPASRQALEPFEVRPTPATVGASELPDELMIDWTNVPVGQLAELYLPAVDADAVLQRAAELYRTHRLTRVDAHTIGCVTGGVSYIPLPKGAGDEANLLGLLSVNLPYGIKKGQNYTAIVRQLTNVAGSETPPPPPGIAAVRSKVVAAPAALKWRGVLGTFQINIPVSTKELLLPREEQRLSIFRWIAEAMPPQRRWYPVFQRYLEGIAGRVSGFGGDPTEILPSPTGEGRRKHPRPEGHDRRRAFTGKIAGLIFDRFGDFEGFVLDTEEGERKFFNREREMKDLAERAWRERLRIIVSVERDEPHRPLSIIVREPPASFER